MPTYEYECSKGHHFEVEQPITAPALKRCKRCRAKARRLISASHFILKGSGWYADGYGSGKPKSGDKAAEPEAKSESKSDKKSDSGAKSDASKGSGKSTSGSAASAAS